MTDEEKRIQGLRDKRKYECCRNPENLKIEKSGDDYKIAGHPELDSCEKHYEICQICNRRHIWIKPDLNKMFESGKLGFKGVKAL